MYRWMIWVGFTLLSSIPGAVYAALHVVTTTQDSAALVQAVGGAHVQVLSLTRGTRDPHFADATPSMIRQVYSADLLVLIGADLEIGWLTPLVETSRNSRVLPGAPGYLDLSTAVTLLDKPAGPVSRAQGDVHARGNPHYWLDPRRGLLMAQAIATRLATLDPAHAGDYRAQLATFQQTLERRLSTWQAQLAPLRDQPMLAYHPSFVYLAQAFGWRIVAHVEPQPGIPPSAAHLQQLIGVIRAQKIGVLIMEPYYERRSGEYLARETGIKVVVLPQSVGARADIVTYADLFDSIVTAFKAAGALP